MCTKVSVWSSCVDAVGVYKSVCTSCGLHLRGRTVLQSGVRVSWPRWRPNKIPVGSSTTTTTRSQPDRKILWKNVGVRGSRVDGYYTKPRKSAWWWSYTRRFLARQPAADEWNPRAHAVYSLWSATAGTACSTCDFQEWQKRGVCVPGTAYA